MQRVLRWCALVSVIATANMQLGCGDADTDDATDPPAPAAQPAHDWTPGQVEDARDAPEEKITPWEPRQGHAGHGQPVIAVLAHNAGTELADFMTAFGVLAQANVAHVMSVSTEPGVVRMNPLVVETETTIDGFDAAHAGGADYVIVPFVMDSKNPRLLDWISAQASKGATIVSVCLGGLSVASTGLMDGHRATSHWGTERVRAMEFPDVRWQKNTRWVADGKIVSSAGISAVIPISVALIEAIAGRERASAVATELGLTSWTSKHDSDAFQLRAGEVPPSMGPIMTSASLGIPLKDRMDEISLALTADAYMHSRQVNVFAVADTLKPISTLSGLRVVPERTLMGSEQVDHVLPYEDVKPSTQALDAALRAIEAEYGEPAACQAARTMEHPSYADCP